MVRLLLADEGYGTGQSSGSSRSGSWGRGGEVEAIMGLVDETESF